MEIQKINGSCDNDMNVTSFLDDVSFADTLNNPFLLTKRTSGVLFNPKSHATIMKRMVALAPHHHALVLTIFGLTAKTGVHHVHATNGASVTHDIPRPHGHRIPLFD